MLQGAVGVDTPDEGLQVLVINVPSEFFGTHFRFGLRYLSGLVHLFADLGVYFLFENIYRVNCMNNYLLRFGRSANGQKICEAEIGYIFNYLVS